MNGGTLEWSVSKAAVNDQRGDGYMLVVLELTFGDGQNFSSVFGG